MELKPLKSKSLVQAVIDEIISQIKNGDLKPGDKLDSQRVLSKRYQVGRNCIREAIQSLSLANIVSIRPGKGVIVTNISASSLINPVNISIPFEYKNKEELLNLWNVRSILEIGSISETIKNINDNDILLLEEFLEDLNNFIKNTDFKSYDLKDIEFHKMLIGCTHNPVLINIYNFVSNFLPKALSMKKQAKKTLLRGMKEHSEVINNLKKRDISKVYENLNEHLENSKLDFIKIINSNSEG